MKTLLEKIAKAKSEIKSSKMEKKGLNKFSNYKYFTPEQIEEMVSTSCANNGLVTSFNLKRNEFGTFGTLTIWELETGEKLEYEMATAIPEIKATNIAQQLGGCVTYTERYLKTSAFGIVDNSLDFDTTENTEKASKESLPNVPKTLTKTANKWEEKMNACKSLGELANVWDEMPQEAKIELIDVKALCKSMLTPNGKLNVQD